MAEGAKNLRAQVDAGLSLSTAMRPDHFKL